MTTEQFFQQLEAAIARYDLLCHPFYQAWAAGQLTRTDLLEYGRDYYPHVEAFPAYLGELSGRLEPGELRRAIEANLRDELGGEDLWGEPHPSHADLWLDFVAGMGGSRDARGHEPVAEVRGLLSFFHRLAREASPEECLAAFYAYESQVPRVAREKARGLRELYGADDKTRAYFTLHTTADVYHSQVWRQQLKKRVEAHPAVAEKALAAAEAAAQALWHALDGIEARRQQHAPQDVPAD
jgi:pyrroloquinoline-quinone synthase